MSVGGGAHNAELGIAIQDAIAANARMEGKDGLAAQQAWGSTYLLERMMGMVMALAVVATPMIFMHTSARIGALWVGGLFIGVMAVYWSRGSNAKDLNTIRAAQLAAYRAEKTTGAGAPRDRQGKEINAQDR
jgi:hypothetical protein